MDALDRIFARCPLDDFKSVRLQDRVDTKFVVPARLVPGLLESVSGEYAALEIAGKTVHRYESLYFDTPDFDFYNDHARGRKPRSKVRMRHYCANDLFWLEHKRKKELRTKKKRIEIESISPELSPECLAFLSRFDLPCAPGELRPALWTRFDRVTLRDLAGTERATVDFGLSVERWLAPDADPGAVRRIDFSPVAIVELKQSRVRRDSPPFSELRARGLAPRSWSKYSVGCSLLVPGLKANAFKPQRLLLEKLST